MMLPRPASTVTGAFSAGSVAGSKAHGGGGATRYADGDAVCWWSDDSGIVARMREFAEQVGAPGAGGPAGAAGGGGGGGGGGSAGGAGGAGEGGAGEASGEAKVLRLPMALTGTQRKLVHELAETLGLQHW